MWDIVVTFYEIHKLGTTFKALNFVSIKKKKMNILSKTIEKVGNAIDNRCYLTHQKDNNAVNYKQREIISSNNYTIAPCVCAFVAPMCVCNLYFGFN